MKLAPVLQLQPKSAREKAKAWLRRLRGKASAPPRPATQAPAQTDPAPRRTRSGGPIPASSHAPVVAPSTPAIAPVAATATRKKKPPKKNPFLSTPVPDTFRPPAPPAPRTAAPVSPARPEPVPAPANTQREALRPPRLPQIPVAALASVHAPPASPNRFPPPTPRGPASVAPAQAQPIAPRAPGPSLRAPAAARAPLPAPLPRTSCSCAPVRAVAVAHEHANAVGTVELSCSAQGLQLQFVRISAFTDGYVPYPVTSSLRTTVPYEQVTRVTIDGDGLVHLVLDPSSTPYNKLALAGLVHDKVFDHAASHRKRARIERQVTLAALVAWMPVALVLRVVWPDWSAWFVLAISATVSALLHLVRKDVASKLVLFSRSNEQVRDELLAELRWRLMPGRVQFAAPSEMPAPEATPAELGEPDPAEAGSLKGLFATAGIVTAAAAIAILVGKNLLFSTAAAPEAQWGQDTDEAWAWLDSPERPASTPPLPDRSATAPIGPDTTPPAPPPTPCVCDRADSPLWAEGIPRMSVLSRNRPGTTSPERPSVYPEIAVVNNSAEDLKDIVMVVDFILGPRNGAKPRIVGKQDLFWEGKLTPGKAVKWRVRGRGDDFSVTSFVDGMLNDKAAPAAPADAFHDLAMTANTPSVRLHGTAMLAYLGDERVHEALEKLRKEASFDMAGAIEQIDLAARPLRVCSVRSSRDSGKDAVELEACVFNASKEHVQNPTVTARLQRGDDVREGRWNLGTALGPGMGARTRGRVALPEPSQGTARDELVGVVVVAEKY